MLIGENDKCRMTLRQNSSVRGADVLETSTASTDRLPLSKVSVERPRVVP